MYSMYILLYYYSIGESSHKVYESGVLMKICKKVAIVGVSSKNLPLRQRYTDSPHKQFNLAIPQVGSIN